MVIITSLNNFFPYCSDEVQLNKYPHKLASYRDSQAIKSKQYKSNLKIMILKRGIEIDHCNKK